MSTAGTLVDLARVDCPGPSSLLEAAMWRISVGVIVVLLGAFLCGPAVRAQQPASPAVDAGKTATQPSLNLNTATLAQLETLPGVGPSLAGRIIEYRQKNGPFKKVEELMNIRGIGEKNFLRLKPLVTVTPPKV
jgi:comEA protein